MRFGDDFSPFIHCQIALCSESIGRIFAFFLAKENWRMGFDAWQAKDFATTYPHVPLYPSKIAVSIGISLLCLQIIADWVGSIKELFGFERQNNT